MAAVDGGVDMFSVGVETFTYPDNGRLLREVYINSSFKYQHN